MESHVSTDLVAHSGRFRLAINELNYHFARLAPGVSQDKAESTPQDAGQYSDHRLFDDDDLVAKLITDENVIWKQLLANAFCTKMKTEKKGVLDSAFKTYMIQDFLFCGRVLLYHTERSLKAPNQAEYKNLTGKISSNADYSYSLLETCTGNLGLQDTTVLQTAPAKATTDYKDFVVEVAENVNYDWVVTLVAMVPCIQSYYQLAVDIRDYQPTPDKTTLWYVNWVEPNVQYESSIKKQIQFFKDHAAEWKKATYTDLRKIFRDACQREIDLWAVAI